MSKNDRLIKQEEDEEMENLHGKKITLDNVFELADGKEEDEHDEDEEGEEKRQCEKSKTRNEEKKKEREK